MKGIILAAGYGSRMYPLAQDMPKCLLTIKGETFLARQLRILKGCEIKDIHVVTGFHREKIAESYGKEVSIHYNPHYEITNSIYSLWMVRDLLIDDSIILNADTVFTEKVLESLMDNRDTYCLAVDKKKCDVEARKVTVKDGIITDIGKELPPQRVYGEFIGVARILEKGTEPFLKAMWKCVKKDSNLGWPMIFAELIEEGYVVKFIRTKGPWIEIDTVKDYEESKELFEKK